MRGDRVEVLDDAGDGVRTYEITATRAGRRVEVSSSRGLVEVTELTRTNESVRTARFMATRVIALVEHPAVEGLPSAREATAPRGRAISRRDDPQLRFEEAEAAPSRSEEAVAVPSRPEESEAAPSHPEPEW